MKYQNSIFLVLLLTFMSVHAQWYPQNSGTSERIISSFALNENYVWVGGDDGLILKTTNGGTDWTSSTIPSSSGKHVFSIFFQDPMNGWAVLERSITGERYGRIVKTTDGGESWETKFEIYGILLMQMHIGPEAVFAVGSSGLVIKSTDGGENWQSSYISPHWLRSIFFANNEIGWISNDLGEVFRTADGGDTWDFISKPVQFFALDIFFINEYVGWVVGMEGFIAKTYDGGHTWTVQYSGTLSRLNEITMINSNLGYIAGFDGTILTTTNSGVNWQNEISDTFEDLYTVSFSNFGKGWVAGTNGTILAIDNAVVPVELIAFNYRLNENKVFLNWSTATELNNHGFEVQRSFNNIEWQVIDFVEGQGTSSNNHNYSVTNTPEKLGQIFYRLNQIDFDGSSKIYGPIEVEYLGTFDFALEQNFPNPFNPTTTIQFSIPKEENVKVTVTNSLGQVVSELINARLETGNHKIEFDASDYSSGVYFYRIEAGDPSTGSGQRFVNTKKMILLK